MNYMRYVSDCTSGLYHNMLQQHGWVDSLPEECHIFGIALKEVEARMLP